MKKPIKRWEGDCNDESNNCYKGTMQTRVEFFFLWKKKKSRSSCYVTIYYKLYKPTFVCFILSTLLPPHAFFLFKMSYSHAQLGFISV